MHNYVETSSAIAGTMVYEKFLDKYHIIENIILLWKF